MSRKIEVDTKTFVRFWLVILGFALLALFIWKALYGLILVGISLFLAIAIRPLVAKIDNIDKKHKRPVLSAVVAYLIVMLVIGFAVAVIGPVVVRETTNFVGQIPETFQNSFGGWDGINRFGENVGIDDMQGEIVTALKNFSANFFSNFGSNLFNGIGAVANVLVSTVLVLVLTLLFLLEGPKIMNGFWNTLSGKHRNRSIEEARRIIRRMARVISVYVSKQVTVALIDGAMTGVIVFALALMFDFVPGLALPMGLITAICYLVPMFGQIIGCILVAMVLFFNNPAAGIIFAIFYIIYAQIENNIIAPKIQGDSLNLPPVVILVAITIGVYMLGPIGAIVAIPVAGCVRVLIEEYPRLKELQDEK